MQLNDTICYNALCSRDKRFDGRFFTAVTSTGIFCRPICPAVTPKAEHCRFLPSAAAALEQGFRPCLRCRPESAPGSPAWNGVSTTVARAVRLIQEGVLGDSNIEALSDRLGVTSRHLRRLFQEHVGASPTAFARSLRLMLALQLIRETSLPFGQVALTAGFGSVRRFNDTIHNLYGRSPGDLRKKQAGSSDHVGHGVQLKLEYKKPYDWERLLGFFQSRAIPGVESVENDVYKRSIQIGDSVGVLEVSNDASIGKLSVGFTLSETVDLHGAICRVRRIFDVDTNRSAIDRQFAGDALLGDLVAKRPGMCVPGAWDRFELGVRAILGQQISVKAACTLAGRFVEKFGQRLTKSAAGGVSYLFPTAQSLLGQDIASIGIPKKRAACIASFAEEYSKNGLNSQSATSLVELETELCRLPGIGPWTAQYIALRAFNEPDAFPVGDVGIYNAMRALGFEGSLQKMPEVAEAWRPFRAYAVLHLWTSLAENNGEKA